MTPPLSLEEAQARLLEGVEPIGVQKVPADCAVGRWLRSPGIVSSTCRE